MTEQRILLTAEEFFEQYSHKEGSYELVKGEVVEMAPPGWDHGEIALILLVSLEHLCANTTWGGWL
jgi:Uma2 family endonuclease